MNATAAAIETAYGTVFETGPICTTIYQVAGGSVDYGEDVLQADYSLTFELRDRGTYGFILPPNQIEPSVMEAFVGVEYLLANME